MVQRQLCEDTMYLPNINTYISKIVGKEDEMLVYILQLHNSV